MRLMKRCAPGAHMEMREGLWSHQSTQPRPHTLHVLIYSYEVMSSVSMEAKLFKFHVISWRRTSRTLHGWNTAKLPGLWLWVTLPGSLRGAAWPLSEIQPLWLDLPNSFSELGFKCRISSPRNGQKIIDAFLLFLCRNPNDIYILLSS